MISDMEEEAKESTTSGGKSGLKPILETRSQSSEAVAAWKHKNMPWIADKVVKLVDLQQNLFRPKRFHYGQGYQM